ncbi:DUF2071 domain-containing protein [Effusibacillus consociatus]|uniref:DUF2071 domain-containing protein n=1 Tax=Effusibacillus consociatus TaxID=1117041 RepID=A0ABV9PYR0_9BACL
MRLNPFTMLGQLDGCLLFMYCCPADKVRHLVPQCLELVTYKGNAIIGVVVSRLKHMRPWPLPKWTGIGYRHVAYRIYVEYTPPGQEPIQGLYFLRSEANNPLMKKAGNLLTDFRFHLADITLAKADRTIDFKIENSDDGLGNARARLSLEDVNELPPTSIFSSVEEALHVLHYEPYGIFVDQRRKKVNVVKVTRDESQWRERTIRQKDAVWTYWDHIIPEGLVHQLTVWVDSIPYRWERGVEYPI